METSILNEFLVLKETNSFSKAAQRLGISQGTLSRHIKQLEEENDIILFERSTQKVRLSSYGEAMASFAQDLLDRERSFQRELEGIKFKTSNHLVVGTVDFPYYYGITSLLGAFKKQYPNATLEVQVGSSDELLRMLDAGKVDVAFLRDIIDSVAPYDAFFYKEDHLRVVVPQDHHLANQSRIRIQDVAEDTFYRRYQKHSLLDQLINGLFADAGISPKASGGKGSWEDSIINEIDTVTLCTGAVANNCEGNIHLKVLELEPQVHADLWLAKSKEAQLPDIAQRFFAYVKASVPS